MKAKSMVAVASAVLAMAAVGGAGAQEVGPLAEQVITADSGITRLYIGDDLRNDVDLRGVSQTYPVANNGDSGTLLAVDDRLWGPTGLAPTPVSQTPVTGSGTRRDPYKVVTTVAAGSTGMETTQTDTYVEGALSYRTSVKVINTGTQRQKAILYRYVDCEVGIPEQETPDGGVDDGGFSRFFARTDSPACLQAESATTPGTTLLGLLPVSGGSGYQAGVRTSTDSTNPGVVSQMQSARRFDNSFDKGYVDDNAVGISWNIAVPAGGSVTRTSLLSFSKATLSGR